MNLTHVAEGIMKPFFNERSLNKIKSAYCSIFLRNYFTVAYRDYFEIKLKDGTILKFNEKPFFDLMHTLKGYVRNYKLKKGDYVVDAGAYSGVYAIYASKMVGNGGKVIAFEPDVVCFEKLARNIKLNNADNIIAINKGLWNSEEVMEIDSRDNKDSTMVKCLNEPVKGKIEKSSFVKLDTALKDLNINKVDFLKMDIEGAELEAIEGARETLQKNSVNLAIASYHVRNNEKTCVRLESLLKDMGYEAKTEFPEHLTTYAHKKA